MANLLHTKSSYYDVKKLHIPLEQEDPQYVLEKLQKRENAFAQTLGFSDYEYMLTSFKNFLTAINKRDLAFLRAFQSNNISKTRTKIINYLEEKEKENKNNTGKIQINFKNNECDLKEIIIAKLQKESVKVDIENLTIYLDFKNIKELEKIINESVDSKKKGKNLNNIAKIFVKENVYTISQNKKNETYSLTYKDYLFNHYTAEEYNNLEDKEKKKINKEIRTIIKEKITNGISDAMIKSIDKVLKIFKGDYSFFFVGSGYLQGPFGEFQTALVLQYLKEFSNEKMKKLAINFLDIGAESEHTVKGNVDVMVNSFGIQTKNRADGILKKEDTTIDTTLLLGQLGERIENFENSGISQFLANYYFNTSIQSKYENKKNDVIDYFQKHIEKIASYDYDKAIKSLNVVYMIGGKYLVPASFLYKQLIASLEAGEKSVKISSAFQGFNDEHWEEKDPKGNAFFTKYWIPIENSKDFQPTDENKNTYNNLMNNNTLGIKIKTQLHGKRIFEEGLEKYKLF